MELDYVPLLLAGNRLRRVSLYRLAADLAPRLYTKAPVVAAVVYDWTGFYIGGNAGYSWGRASADGTLTGTQNVSVFRTAGPDLISSTNTVLAPCR